ncbi:MAG: hypothetical protein M3348_05325 [Acidobacteriota bacterium]|nr:hypothetical protein [Acidobacteriota bacterium]
MAAGLLGRRVARGERFDAFKNLTRADRIKPDDYDATVAPGSALFGAGRNI